jgi:hypothetical protein
MAIGAETHVPPDLSEFNRQRADDERILRVLFKLSAVRVAAKQRPVVQADVVLSLSALGSYNLAVHDNVHVVFPLRMSASLA